MQKKPGLASSMFWSAILFSLALGLSVWQNDQGSERVRISKPLKRAVSRLDQLRPAQCLDETKDTMFGDHYYPVHQKSAFFRGKECRYRDFEVSSKNLGVGGYGTVRKGVYKSTNQTFALKSIIEMNPDWHKWIRAEECIQYGLDFPLITKHYCTMLHDWYAWLVLELVDGETLQKLLQRGHFKFDPKRVVAQLVFTLQYLQLNNIVVGDLTAANVMITRDGDVKLIDFGFARRRDPGKAATPPTWNESRVLPDFGSNPYSDWYGLGIVIYEMEVAMRKGIKCPPVREGETRKDINPNMPLGIGRSEPRGWSNCAWIRPQKLKFENCLSLLDVQACDLIGKFIGQTSTSNWKATWGVAEGSIEQIRSHPWFSGFNWTTLDNKLSAYMKLNAYNS